MEPIEFIPRLGGLGLGATPRAPPPDLKRKIRKPGEVEKKVVHLYSWTFLTILCTIVHMVVMGSEHCIFGCPRLQNMLVQHITYFGKVTNFRYHENLYLAKVTCYTVYKTLHEKCVVPSNSA